MAINWWDVSKDRKGGSFGPNGLVYVVQVCGDHFAYLVTDTNRRRSGIAPSGLASAKASCEAIALDWMQPDDSEQVDDAPLDVAVQDRWAQVNGPKQPKPAEPTETFAESVKHVLTHLERMLRAKNKAYGNSALEPVRVFSKADKAEQIRVRIDDKLSRLARGSNAGEDVLMDLMGYLVLLWIAEKI